MSAFVIVEVKINDPVKYEEYKSLAFPAVKQYGGNYIARGGKAEKLEGKEEPDRVVILEFESAGRVKEWWNSPEYSKAKSIRHACADTRMVIIEGLEAPL